jgi:hypothetical protein
MRLRPQRIGSSVYVYREGGGVALSVPCAQGTPSLVLRGRPTLRSSCAGRGGSAARIYASLLPSRSFGAKLHYVLGRSRWWTGLPLVTRPLPVVGFFRAKPL